MCQRGERVPRPCEHLRAVFALRSERGERGGEALPHEGGLLPVSPQERAAVAGLDPQGPADVPRKDAPTERGPLDHVQATPRPRGAGERRQVLAERNGAAAEVTKVGRQPLHFLLDELRAGRLPRPQRPLQRLVEAQEAKEIRPVFREGEVASQERDDALDPLVLLARLGPEQIQDRVARRRHFAVHGVFMPQARRGATAMFRRCGLDGRATPARGPAGGGS